MPIKIKGPKGVTSISVDGVQYDADKKGNFSLPDGTDPACLSPLGFAVADAESTDAPADVAASPAPDAPAAAVDSAAPAA